MNLSTLEIQQYLGLYLWPFFRIASMLMVMPIIGNRMLPFRLRLILAAMMTIVIAPIVPHAPSIDPISYQGMLLTASQILIGVMMGFVFKLVFEIFTIGGQVIAMQSGLGFASMVDPATGNSVPLISQFYLIFVSLLFLSLNGHLMLIQALVTSFTTLPVSHGGFALNSIWELLNFSSVIFKGGVLVALPAIISLLLVNISFGVMTRAAPQLNIFTIGFPITLTLGLVVIYLTLSGVPPHFEYFLGAGFDVTHTLLNWN